MNCNMRKLLRVLGVLNRCACNKQILSGLPEELICEINHYSSYLQQLVLDEQGLGIDVGLSGALDKLLDVCKRFSSYPIANLIGRKLGELFEDDISLYQVRGKAMFDIYFVGPIAENKVNIITGYLTPEAPYVAHKEGKQVFKGRAPAKHNILTETRTRPIYFLSNEVKDVRPVSPIEDFDHLMVRQHLLSGK